MTIPTTTIPTTSTTASTNRITIMACTILLLCSRTHAMTSNRPRSSTSTTATTATSNDVRSEDGIGVMRTNRSTSTSVVPNKWKRSAAGYPRRELMMDAVEEQRRVQQLREDMYTSLGLTSPLDQKQNQINNNNNNKINNNNNLNNMNSNKNDNNSNRMTNSNDNSNQWNGKNVVSVTAPSMTPSDTTITNINSSKSVRSTNLNANSSSKVVKKRRGRPPGKKNSISTTTSALKSKMATAVAAANNNTGVKRRRGRRPGSKNKPKVTDLNSISSSSSSNNTNNNVNINKNKDESSGQRYPSSLSSSRGINEDFNMGDDNNNYMDEESDPTMLSNDSNNDNSNSNAPFDRPMSPNTQALQKFYDSDLLTTNQEKLFGYRVQYLVRCEEVHEGLELNLGREPTFVEWAVACGYTSDDLDDVDTLEKLQEYETAEDLRVLRPVAEHSSPADTAEFDPSLTKADKERLGQKDMPIFVGSVTAGTGIGRGKGRAKKPPRQTLDEIIVKDKVLLRVIEELAQLSGRDIQSNDTNTSNNNNNSSRGSTSDFIQDLTIARDAKKTMVKSNMRLVISIARRYQKVGVNLQDLVQEGSLGLMRATEKYDPGRGFKFSTYASWWIQQAVFRAIAYHSRTIRLPVHVHNLLNRARKVRSELQAELGRVPLDKEIAEQLNMTPEKLTKVLLMTRKSVSLEQPRFKQNPKDLGQESEMVIGEAIDGSKISSTASGTTDSSSINDSPESQVDQDLFHADLEEMLTILGNDEKRVIRLRYGMEDGMTRTVSSVSDIMNKPKSWVRSQECRALRKLRRPWYEKKLKEHQNSLTS